MPEDSRISTPPFALRALEGVRPSSEAPLVLLAASLLLGVSKTLYIWSYIQSQVKLLSDLRHRPSGHLLS